MNKTGLLIILVLSTIIVAMQVSAICVCNNHPDCEAFCNGGGNGNGGATTIMSGGSNGGGSMMTTFVITQETPYNDTVCLQGFQRRYINYFYESEWHRKTYDNHDILMKTCINRKLWQPLEPYTYNRYGGRIWGVMFDKTIYYPLEETK